MAWHSEDGHGWLIEPERPVVSLIRRMKIRRSVCLFCDVLSAALPAFNSPQAHSMRHCASITSFQDGTVLGVLLATYSYVA